MTLLFTSIKTGWELHDSEAEALRCREEFKWDVMDDAGRGWRRVVPSPFPIRILEMETIKTLVNNGVITITSRRWWNSCY